MPVPFTSYLTRAERPFPLTKGGITNGLQRAANARAATAAQAAVAQASAKTQAQIAAQLNRQIIQSRVASTAARVAQVSGARAVQSAASNAASAVSQVAAQRAAAVSGGRLGAIAVKVSPYLKRGGPFIALAALAAIPAAMEVYAPDVQNWLLGGWRGPGYGKSNPTGGGIVLDGDPNAFYTIEMWGNNGSGVMATYVLNSIQGLQSARLDGSSGQWFIYYTGAFTGGEVGVGTFRNAGIWTGVFLRFRKNGVYLEPQPSIDRPSLTTNPTTQQQSNPLTAPKNADQARNAALGAVAATLLAQRTATAPPNTRNLGRNQQRRFGTDLDPSSPPTPPPSRPCQGNACGQAALDQSTKNGEDLSKILDLLNSLGIEDMKKKLDVIDDKIGAQIFDGSGNKTGLAGAALQTFERLNKVGDYLRFDRIMNVLTFITTVHNAAMLSRNLGETLAQAISNGLAAIGIRDVDNNPLQIGNIIGKSVEGMITSAIGAENYQALNATWKKANRIYQASANLLNNIQSLRYSITGALETIGGWNARIGNALKRFGVVGDSAYSWMNPSPNFDNQWMRSLETIENAVSSVDSVASEILSAQETVNEITRAKTELETAVTAGTEKPQLENTQQKNKATAAKSASASPNINPEDTVKPST